MVNYVQWNEVIFNHFYNENNAGKIIYLYVNSELIKSLGKEKFGLNDEEAIDSFRKSVSYFSPLISRLFLVGYSQGLSWYNNGMKGIPPFIGLLAITVFAASKMGNDLEEGIGGGNYYYPIRELLDSLDESGKPPFFEKTVDLWKMLYLWQEKNNFQFGKTPSFPYGTAFTGYPRSQCLIRDSDKLMLNEFFERFGYSSESIIDRKILKSQLERFLESRIGRLRNLFFMQKQNYQKHLVEQIEVELESWKKIKHLQIAENSSMHDNFPKSLKTNLHREVEMLLVFKFQGKLSKRIGELYFTALVEELNLNNFKTDFFELNSSFVKKEISDFDEITLNFKKEIEKLDLSFIYRGNEILFFKQGNDLGIYGWVSRRVIEENTDYIIMYKNNHYDLVTNWLSSNNIKIKEKINNGILDDSFNLVLINTGELLENLDDLENTNNYFINYVDSKLKLEGGLKISNTEWMYNFSPRLTINAGLKSEVKINDIPSFSLLSNEVNINLNTLFLKPGTYKIGIPGNKNRYVTVIEEKEIIHNRDSVIIPNLGVKVNSFISFGVSSVSSNKPFNLWVHPNKTGFYLLEEPEGDKLEIHVPKKLRDAQPYSRTLSELIIHLELSHKPRLRLIDTFVEYLTYSEKGNRSSFIKGVKECFGEKDLNLTAYIIKKNLIKLGIIEVEEQSGTNQFYWRVTSTAACYIPCSYDQHALYITGARTRKWLLALGENQTRGINIYYFNPKSDFEPISLYITSKKETLLHEFLDSMSIFLNKEITEYFSFELSKNIPTLLDLFNTISPIDEKLYSVDFESWNFDYGHWRKGNHSNLLRIRDKYINKCFIREKGLLFEVDNELGKGLLAAKSNIKFFNYRPFVFQVNKQYHLPDVYERVLTLCSGLCPLETKSHRVYQNVPVEIAIMILYKLGYKTIDL